MSIRIPAPEQILITGAKVYDPVSGKSWSGDVGVRKGILCDAQEIDQAAAEVIDGKGCVVTHGFIDIHAHFREPGGEDKETLATGARAALAGGFVKVCIMPNTEPPIDSPEKIRFIMEKAGDLPIDLAVIAAVTWGQKGTELAELLEMHAAGAIAFSDDGVPIENGQILKLALRYTAPIGVPIINHAEDVHLRGDGVMNEGALSTRLGLPGNPTQAEAAMVHRDLLIAEDVQGRLHVPHISTRLAVEQVRQFKAKGLSITAEAAPHHIGLTEDAISNYDTNAKVAPPLRSDADRQAVLAGLLDGTIDCIATDHAPHTIESKEMDILHAPCGMIGLESAYGVSNRALMDAGAKFEQVIDLLTTGPAAVMGFELKELKIGTPAQLVLVDPKQEWTFSRADVYSRSRNTPFIGQQLKGKVKATITPQGYFRQ
ncbi:dihydroorotase [Candidatus Neomarinimicrobiota bacterium]